MKSQLASVLRRGYAGEPLTPDEEFQFRLRSNALLRYWEDVHYQQRHGLYDEVEFTQHRAAWKEAFANSVGLVKYWREVRGLYSPLFAAELGRADVSMIMALGSLVAAGVLTMLVVKPEVPEAESAEKSTDAPVDLKGAVAHGR